MQKSYQIVKGFSKHLATVLEDSFGLAPEVQPVTSSYDRVIINVAPVHEKAVIGFIAGYFAALNETMLRAQTLTQR